MIEDQKVGLKALSKKAARKAARNALAFDPKTVKERTRAYQMEMLDESLKRNIVVAMDTGSGKTHIAILRILGQINAGGDKISWFLVPNVALGEQQYAVLKASLPPVHICFLSGRDGVDKWSDQATWDNVLGLKGSAASVIVSTHQILLDALSHGFLRIDRIGLLVFDEAHHCVLSHPANRIMQHHYHPQRLRGLEVPAILGLTASPVVKAKPDQLRTIEANLNAIARTPIINRDELMSHVHPPVLKRVMYAAEKPYYEPISPEKQNLESQEEALFEHVDVEKLLGVGINSAKRKASAPLIQGNGKEKSKPENGGYFAFGDGVPLFRKPGVVGSSGSKKAGAGSGSDNLFPGPMGATRGWFGSLSAMKDANLWNSVQDDNDEFERFELTIGEVDFPIETVPLKKPKTREEARDLQMPDLDLTTDEDEYERVDPSTLFSPKSVQGHKILRNKWNAPGPATASSKPNTKTPAFESFLAAYRSMDILQDPYVTSLMSSPRPDKVRIDHTIETRNTYSYIEMDAILKKALHLVEDYGAWATEWFIERVVSRFCKLNEDSGELYEDWRVDEKSYLKSILKKVKCPKPRSIEAKGMLTQKVEKLIEVLLEAHSSDGEEFAGLVFVEQRIGVAALAEILDNHPKTRKLFRTGTTVGSSGNTRGVSDLIDARTSFSSLEDFRSGKKNLVISTSVVEEGLDIQACNLVVSFQLPQNVKSFIQRRGRARHEKSVYVLMFEETAGAEVVETFQNLEKEMIEVYSNIERELENSIEEEEEEEGDRSFLVESTGAILTLDSAVSHLYHFCACLPTGQHIDLRPIFSTYEVLAEDPLEGKRFTSDVLLPNCIPPKIRRTSSKQSWKTERAAKRDAAFEAYLELYRLDLVDDHLMPLHRTANDPEVVEALKEIQKKPATLMAEKTIDPWPIYGLSRDVFFTCDDSSEAELLKTPVGPPGPSNLHWAAPIRIMMPDEMPVELEILIGTPCPPVGEFNIYWTNQEVVKASVGETRFLGPLSPEDYEKKADDTYNLFWNIFSSRMVPGQKDFPYLIQPKGNDTWNTTLDGKTGRNALEIYRELGEDGIDPGLVRDLGQNFFPYIFVKWRADLKPKDLEDLVAERYRGRYVDPDQPLLEVTKLSKRRDFLHKQADGAASFLEKKTILLLPQYCQIDFLPWRYSKAVLFLPGIIHRIETNIIASDLQNTLLKPVNIRSTPLVLTAISASSAQEDTDYQRFEFLGDSVLKFLTAMQLMDDHPFWHEGYLTRRKDQAVANIRLAVAAVDKGLGKWILSSLFTAQKWRPRYISDEVDTETKKETSTKVLADVVEALIGASYLEGGYEKALSCAAIFGLNINWQPLETRVLSLFNKASTEINLPGHLADLEKLVGHTFTKKTLLLEATTHPSCESDMAFLSYQRLEYLGDSVLDMVVINEIFHWPSKEYSQVDMHLFKSSVVNEHLLAFLSLGLSTELPRRKVIKTSKGVEMGDKLVHFWAYLRHNNNSEMIKAQKKVWDNYRSLKHQIQTALDRDALYPWVLLIGLEADKFFSDIVESVLGAVYIDTCGDFSAVKRVAEKFGILRVLRRILEGEVNVRHPVLKLGEKVAAVGQGTVVYRRILEKGAFSCEAIVNGEVVVKAEDGSSWPEARARAAGMAFDIVVEMEKKKKIENQIKREHELKEVSYLDRVEKEGKNIFFDAPEVIMEEDA